VIARGFYALGSTWLPTLVGTAVAVLLAPLYVVLREHWGATGLAIASAIAILTYVLLLGWLQHRRFDREARAHGTTLKDVPGILDGALRLACAATVAIGAGLVIRDHLNQLLPGLRFGAVLGRAALLSTVGVGVFVIAAYILRVGEIAEIAAVARRKLILRRLKAANMNKRPLASTRQGCTRIVTREPLPAKIGSKSRPR
jgi:putative peptidoglycan lipid II flippase